LADSGSLDRLTNQPPNHITHTQTQNQKQYLGWTKPLRSNDLSSQQQQRRALRRGGELMGADTDTPAAVDWVALGT
jgi:hypothetical protein